jgi:cAMP phosphodiesterase
VEELEKLKEKTGQKNLEGLNIVVTHRKPTKNNPEIIKKELLKNNLCRYIIFSLNRVEK